MAATGGDFSGTIFRENWQLKWDPKTEPALIEQNLYGDTVESAALARLREAMAQAGTNAGQTCERLLQAVDMDLPDLVQAAEDACGRAIDSDPSFVSLAAALHHLGILDRYAVFRGLRRDVLEELLTRCYDRACFALPDSAAVPDEEQKGVVNALVTVAEVVQRADADRYDRPLFAEAARRAGERIAGAISPRRVPRIALRDSRIAGRHAGGGSCCSRRSRAGANDHCRRSARRNASGVAHVHHAREPRHWLRPWTTCSRPPNGTRSLSCCRDCAPPSSGLPESQRDSLAATVAKRYGLGSAQEVRAMPAGLGATALVARLDAAVAATLEGLAVRCLDLATLEREAPPWIRRPAHPRSLAARARQGCRGARHRLRRRCRGRARREAGRLSL